MLTTFVVFGLVLLAVGLILAAVVELVRRPEGGRAQTFAILAIACHFVAQLVQSVDL